MTSHQSEKKLDLIINLLETLPQRICNGLENLLEFRERLKEIDSREKEFLRKHNTPINKMMDGVKNNE